jgi:O-acetyl-ADP-ribose deacetylase (regulator of RNase III)
MAEPTHIYGNIFDSHCQTLVNAVNCNGVMGRGIALEFKFRFPDLFENYNLICKKKLLEPGLLYLWKGSGKWVLNFPTKNNWRLPSKLDYIESGLENFARNYIQYNISSIAFSILGSGAGGLDENLVIELMGKYFEPLENIEIEIYHFNPRANDEFFNRIYNKIKRFNVDDYILQLDINATQAQNLIDAINSNEIKLMIDFQKIKGMGEKTIKKLYDFHNDGLEKVETNPTSQLGITFR